MTPISNRTDKEIMLGGLKIPSSTQKAIRGELITQDELKAISKAGFIVEIKPNLITVSNAKKEDAVLLQKDKKDKEISHLAYPKELITQKGEVTGKISHKEDVVLLQETYANILSDNAFKDIYSDVDIDEHRVSL